LSNEKREGSNEPSLFLKSDEAVIGANSINTPNKSDVAGNTVKHTSKRWIGRKNGYAIVDKL
jgi:hypothetical protein